MNEIAEKLAAVAGEHEHMSKANARAVAVKLARIGRELIGLAEMIERAAAEPPRERATRKPTLKQLKRRFAGPGAFRVR